MRGFKCTWHKLQSAFKGNCLRRWQNFTFWRWDQITGRCFLIFITKERKQVPLFRFRKVNVSTYQNMIAWVNNYLEVNEPLSNALSNYIISRKIITKNRKTTVHLRCNFKILQRAFPYIKLRNKSLLCMSDTTREGNFLQLCSRTKLFCVTSFVVPWDINNEWP